MAENLDSESIQQFMQGQPPQPAPAQEETPQDESPEGRKRDAQGRINQLTSRNERLLNALNESNQRYQSLESKLESLESKLGAPQQVKPKSDLEDWTEDDLYVKRAELSNPQAEDYDPKKVALIDKEINTRLKSSLFESLNNKTKNIEKKQSLKGENIQAFNQAVRSLGEDASLFMTPNGQVDMAAPGTKAAASIYQMFEQKYGQDKALAIPDLQRLAVFMGKDYVRSQSGQPTGSPASPAVSEQTLSKRPSPQIPAQSEAAVDRGLEAQRKEALAKGNTKDYLAKSPLIQQMMKDLENY